MELTYSHWSAWPTAGSHGSIPRSSAMSHTRSAQFTLSSSICVVQEWLGRSPERLQCASWGPDLTFTIRLSAICAGITSASRRTCPEAAMRRLWIRLHRLSWPVWLMSDSEALLTKWYKLSPNIRHWQLTWNASCKLCRSLWAMLVTAESNNYV